MKVSSITTERGVTSRIFEAGEGTPIVYVHGLTGIDVGAKHFLARLAEEHRVLALEFPGFGESSGEELLEDMLDFTLHGWDLVDALDLSHVHLIGHSMGGMIAAEMAALAPERVRRLALVNPLGLWLDDHPIADIFALLPYQLARTLFHDDDLAGRSLTDGHSLEDRDALKDFVLDNTRRLGTAGKILFPIPNRRLSKRAYRIPGERVLVVWGAEDRYVPLSYQQYWCDLLPNSTAEIIPDAGHMTPYEQPEKLSEVIARFLN